MRLLRRTGYLRYLISALAGIAILGAAFAAPAEAQSNFPDKPIRLIVPFAPGGLADITMRIVGERLGERLPVPALHHLRARDAESQDQAPVR